MQESVAERIRASDLEYEIDEAASWRLESEGRTCGRKKYETDESVAERIRASDLEYETDESAAERIRASDLEYEIDESAERA